MGDIILRKLFEAERWEGAFTKALDKEIGRNLLMKLKEPSVRIALKRRIERGEYEISPPHIALIPKENPGEYRRVYVNEGLDRIILPMINDILFELTPHRIHRSCKSYLKGVSCGQTVQQVARELKNNPNSIVGFKTDLSKYFDSVPVRWVDAAFDMVEKEHGHSSVIDMLRKYYHSGLYFDEDGNLRDAFDERECGQSLKQGCAVASWLCDVILYDVDEAMSRLDGTYVRYSDDMLSTCPDTDKAMETLVEALAEKGVVVNEKKTELLTHGRWFKFLGFSIWDDRITISRSRLERFQKEIEKRTVKNKNATLQSAIHAVNTYLYRGNGEFAWADQILAICNVRKDISEMNKFVMDCLRAVATGKKKVGHLGYASNNPHGCVMRGIGMNVRSNRLKVPRLDGYKSFGAMRNAVKINKNIYRMLIRTSCA